MEISHGFRIHINGIVQGVGFRPFIYALAKRYNLKGWVKNTSAGVDIDVSGALNELNEFISAIKINPPELAKIDTITIQSTTSHNYSEFEIIESESIEGMFQPISPDISLCSDCLGELLDPVDRRYWYPFINCTNCGPRFTIIEDIPYDRPKTTMSGFTLCPDCAREYNDPSNRRFHAQPIACPTCGPKIWLEKSGDLDHIFEQDEAIFECQKLLLAGNVIAIRGIGGFHLACDATNKEAVNLLRYRKMRVDKPFALMMCDIETVQEHCFLSSYERDLIASKERPIVILTRRPDSKTAESVAPHQSTLGVMLPYSPVHYLLFERYRNANFIPAKILVMTSGNLSEEPIVISNEEAQVRLVKLADYLLLHNRPIRIRCDDSVVRSHPFIPGGIYPIRRSRGFAPSPISLNWEVSPSLAVGGELKNTFCLARDKYAFISQHVGDLQNYETLVSFLDSIDHFERLFKIYPQFVAHDLHPDYLSTRVAIEKSERENIPALAVQHHHAHIAACMAEHNLSDNEPVIGVSLDGTGYGLDGAIWGGEFLLSTYSGFFRQFHLSYMPLLGGDKSIRRPSRIALAYLWKCGLEWDSSLPCVKEYCAEDLVILRSQLEHQINTPLTSSAGRLFDAVSAMLGVCLNVNYEAQAAIELEGLVDPGEERSYPFFFDPGCMEIDLSPIVSCVFHDVLAGLELGLVSSMFHNVFAKLVIDVVMTMRNLHKINTIVLSGGVWQNLTLLKKVTIGLEKTGSRVLTHTRLPPNDGGLALGQLAVAHRVVKH